MMQCRKSRVLQPLLTKIRKISAHGACIQSWKGYWTRSRLKVRTSKRRRSALTQPTCKKCSRILLKTRTSAGTSCEVASRQKKYPLPLGEGRVRVERFAKSCDP